MALVLLASIASAIRASSTGGAEAAGRALVTEVGSGGATPTPLGTRSLTRLTSPEGSVLMGFSTDSRSVLVLAQPAPGEAAQVKGVPVAGGSSRTEWTRPAAFSPDGSYAVELEGEAVRVTRRSSGASWTIANGGRELRFSPDGGRVAWDLVSSGITHPDNRAHSLWVADVTGAHARKVATTLGGGLVGWGSDGQTLIATGRTTANGQEGIWAIALDGSAPRLLHQAYRPRDPLLSPGGDWLAFHVAFTGDPGANGLWILRTDGTALSKVTPFGSYRWRGGGRLLLIPLQSGEAPTLFEVDAPAGQARQLTDPAQTALPIANGDWMVSPDGARVAFTSWSDRSIWLLSLPN